MPCPVRMRGPECLGRDGACVQYAEEMRRHDEPGSEVAESTTCQAADSGTGKCKTAMCNVWIGGKDYCSECATAGEHLVDGKCVAANSDTKCTSNSAGACSSCAQGYFLHRGGCYAIEGAVGLLICDDKTATAGKDGICVTCHEGYFKNPASATDKTKESCIACNQTAAIDRYQGVDKCAACDSSQLPSSGGGTAKCTKCQGTDYLKSDGTACGEKTSTCVSDTEFAKEDAANGNKCVSCGDATDGVTDCKTCTAPSGEGTKPTCTECNNNKIVKTVTASGKSVTSCIEPAECKDGFFVNTADKPNKCTACTANCNTCSAADANKCSACAEGYFVGAASGSEGPCVKCDATGSSGFVGVAGCTKCTRPNTSGTSGTATCDECEAGKKPSEDKTKCNPCADTNCSFCDEQGACQKCSEGYTLEGGKCTSSSANRSALSTGAIAGISVAAVVVVGGLVGFLCWWFICRGKA